MITPISKLADYLVLGNLGEKLVTTIQIDISEWLNEYPDGVLGLSYERPGEPRRYWPASNVTVDYSEKVLTWVVNQHALEIEGIGTLVVRLLSGDSEKRSRQIMTRVNPGHGSVGPIPDAVSDWISEVSARWGSADVTVVLIDAHEEPSSDVVQDETGVHITLHIPDRGFVVDGPYDPLKHYHLNMVVRSDGKSYCYINPTPAAGTSVTDETYWELFSDQGIQGIPGVHFGEEEPTDESSVWVDPNEEYSPFDEFHPAGNYSPDTAYHYKDWVFNEATGGSYGYIYPEPASGVPITDLSHWQQIAEKGDTGPQGEHGLKGDTGAKIVSGEYVGTSLKFTLDDASHFTIPGAKSVPETWLEFQAAVRDGTIDDYFAVGDQFNVLKGATNLVFDIVDIGSSTRNVTANGNAPTDPNYFANFPNAKPVTLMMHDVIYGVMFDNSEANYQITTEIASGAKCNISLESDTIAAATYNFTAPSALSVGGRLRINTAVQLQYYATPASAPVNIAMVAGAADAEYISIAGSLSAQNHKQRVSYGSNKYTESAIRQWLNAGGAAGTFWVSKSNYDLAPSWNATLAGFRNGLDVDFLAVLGETTREVELNTVTDGGGQATISDNIFFPSRMEIYGSVETAGHKGLQFQSYVGLADIDRIKYDTTALSTARGWWMRSSHAGNANSARYVYTPGALSSGTARNGLGAAAACVIL